MLALKQRNDDQETRPILYQEYLNKRNKENIVEEVEESKDDQAGQRDIKEILIKYGPIAVMVAIVFVLAVMILMPKSNEASNDKVIVDKEAVIASSDVNSKAVRTDFGQVLRNATDSINQNQQNITDESNEETSLEKTVDENSGIDTSTSAYTKEQVIEVINGIDGKNGLDGKNGTDGVNGVNGKDGANGISGANGANGKDGINGKDGTNGKDGINGVDGKDGKSAYQTAVEAGYTGTEQEFGQLLSSIGVKIEDIEGNVTSINSTVDTLNQSLNGFKFGIDENGDPGYIKAGADTVTPFKKGSTIMSIGNFSTNTVYISSYYKNFESLTVNNFFIRVTSLSCGSAVQNATYVNSSGSVTATMSYDPTLGVLTVPRSVSSSGNQNQGYGNFSFDLFLII